MSYETILFAVDKGIARLTLNRPDKLNSFNVAMHEEVQNALRLVAQHARVLVLTGAGRGFCAGQDLGDRAVAPGGAAVDLGESIERYYKPLVLALQTLPMPVIAAVNGVAAGAGANIALACDIVIAARSASFVQAFSKLGLVPDCGGTWTLPRLVGPARAVGLTFLGNKLPAEQAAAWGMIWQCVEDAELSSTVTAMAEHFAGAPTQGLARTKAALRASWSNSLADQLDVERDAQRELGRSSDYAEGVAAFSEKRAPRFSGGLTVTPSHDLAAQNLASQSVASQSAVAHSESAVRSLYAGDRLSQLLGIEIVRIAPGCVQAEMPVRSDMANGHGICHGGVLFALADSTFAYACNSHGEAMVGASASIEFLAPAKVDDRLIAIATETYRTDRHGIYDVVVATAAGLDIAHFRGRSTRPRFVATPG